MTRKPSAPAKFTKALRIADTLPEPRHIARTVMQSSTGAHNGLRAASYDGKVKGGSGASHPERVAEQREKARHDTELDDLRKLSKASEKAVDAIGSLLAECADQGYDADDYGWDDALKDAYLLTEPRHPLIEDEEHRKVPDPDHDPTACSCISLLEAADEVGRPVDHWVDRYWAAVVDIRSVHRRYQPRNPTRWQQIKESGINADEICDICASLDPPVYVVARNKKRLACRHCNDLWLEAGEKPTRELKQAFHYGTQLEYRKALSRWFDDLGVRAS